jgi:hypothetical protein
MKRLICLVALVASCQQQSSPPLTPSPKLQEVDDGVIILEGSIWLDQEYNVVLPAEIANVPVSLVVNKSCCTKAEVVSRKGQQLKVKLSGRLSAAEPGPRDWYCNVTEANKTICTLMLRAQSTPSLSLRNSPLMAGVQVKDQPFVWKTWLDYRSPTPLLNPQLPKVESSNPSIVFGSPETKQEGDVYLTSFPVTATFVPQGDGLHEQPIRIVVPGIDSIIQTMFSWYERKGK